ncbi:GTP cyclohydrolase II [Candidatus Daviesbacteria bacterium]|nr:GTP cyclohydrolase II [Candidatus Daviesbacteria bacterium]
MKPASANLPTKYGHFKIFVYQSKKDGREHTVLLKQKNKKDKFLVRIHSQCLTGDTFSSLKCDCRDQLVMSLKKIGKAQNGALIYLNQEGRGIGLTNKIKAYALQDRGLDTIQANKKLGLAADLRDYSVAAEVLKDLGIFQIILLTNNPDKASQLASFGITVKKCIPLEVRPNRINKSYLKTKKEKMGHKLKLV